MGFVNGMNVTGQATTNNIMKPQEIKRPAGMSDKAFDSMVKRNAMTNQKIEALAKSLERGKQCR